MSDLALRVHSLSKLTHIGARIDPHATLCDRLADSFSAPFRHLRTSHFPLPTSHSEDTIWALKDVSFEVERGEVVGIPSLRSGQALAATAQFWA